jgi:hypothetical protein
MTKQCVECKEDKELSEFYYHRQRKYYMSSCKICNNKRSIKFYKDLKIINNLDFQLRSRASELTRRSKIKNLPYDIKMYQTLKEIYKNQNGLCYYTKIEMDTNGFKDDNPKCFVVDRIIPEKGYVKDNMVFCCNAINRIKSSFSITELKWWVDQIQ